MSIRDLLVHREGLEGVVAHRDRVHRGVDLLPVRHHREAPAAHPVHAVAGAFHVHLRKKGERLRQVVAIEEQKSKL